MATVIGKPFISEEARSQLRNELSKAINNKELADVSFQVGDDIFYGHKAILGFRSSVFKKIFCTYAEHGIAPVEGVENAEKSISKSSNDMITIDVDILAGYKVSSTSFKIILTYLYNGELLINHENCLDIFSLARRLSLASASAVCNEYLNELKGGSEVCGLLSAALGKNEMELYHQCLESVEQKTFQCMQSDMFLTLPMEVITDLLKNEKISCTEKELFDAVIRWWGANKEEVAAGLSKEEQDAYLVKHFLYYIRYPLMTPKDVSDIERMKLLSADIIVDAFRHHASVDQALTKPNNSGPIDYSDRTFRTRIRGESVGNLITFDPQKCNRTRLHVSQNNLELSVSDDKLLDYVACLCNTGFKSGVHFWEVTIEKCDLDDHIMIGVATENQKLNQWIGQDDHGWSWFGFNRTHYHGNASTPAKANFGEKDVIGVKLDLRINKNKGGLCFYKNGVPMGLSFTNLNNTAKLFPAVSLRKPNSKVSIKSHDLVFDSIYQTHLSETDQ